MSSHVVVTNVPYPILLVTCVLCRRLHRTVRPLDTHPICATCERCARD